MAKVGRCLLRERLKKNDMTQQQLAEKLNVTNQQINKYATNRQKMSLPVAKKIADILKCRIEDLYEWDEAGE